ncbi:MAG TPA: SEC-C metal-binding domain-containing protein [Stellaceae bacterium]|nr:SEC-C metal-binding domain-containing protein [Stellaceae bacterium]
MTIEDVIRDFASTGSTLPRASMQWALDHWDEAAPAFVELLERHASGEDRSEASREALFFAVLSLQRKLGRNDPCPCGSGKKYKKCCLGENPAAIALQAAQ